MSLRGVTGTIRRAIHRANRPRERSPISPPFSSQNDIDALYLP
jgi:hypothetical protein